MGLTLKSHLPDPDVGPLAGHAGVADVDVLVARGLVETRTVADCDVVPSGGVPEKSEMSKGGIIVARVV